MAKKPVIMRVCGLFPCKKFFHIIVYTIWNTFHPNLSQNTTNNLPIWGGFSTFVDSDPLSLNIQNVID